MAGSESDAVAPAQVYCCVNHPKTETLIRCSKCLDPICPKCSIRTPVGLRCKKCAAPTRSPIYRLATRDIALGVVVSLGTGLLAGMVSSQIGLLFTFFLSAPLGGLVAEAMARSLHGKRGRILQVMAVLAIIVGAAAGPWLWQALTALDLSTLPRSPIVYVLSLLGLRPIAYIVLASGAAIARLR